MFCSGRQSLAELAVEVAEMRWLRAIALEAGLDPDTTPPEDLFLLGKDENGWLLVVQELERARNRLADEIAAERMEQGKT